MTRPRRPHRLLSPARIRAYAGDLSIRAKLTLLLTFTTYLALTVVGGITYWRQAERTRASLEGRVANLAHVIAGQVHTALLFDDGEMAGDLLAGLSVDPCIDQALLFGPDGEVFARWYRHDRPVVPPWELPRQPGAHFTDRRLLVAYPLRADTDPSGKGAERLGTLVLEANLRQVEELAAGEARWALLTALVGGLVAWLFGVIAAKRLARPLLALERAATRVRDQEDFSLRAPKHGDDEIGRLVDAFNLMLATIERREEDLRRLTRDLEGQVHERTAELRAKNASLREAMKQAQEAARAKAEFLANMSHEIRTPMNGIIGMTELAIESAANPLQQEQLELVRSSADHLLHIINDILDFSKIEARKLELVHRPFRVRDHLADTLRRLAVPAQDKGLELAADVEPDVPDTLVGDPDRLGQVLVNLVGNAIKFTDEGEVVVGLEVLEVGDSEAHLHFTVSDTGIGIPEEKLDSIFRAFEQADSSMTRRYGGTGLGLAISSQLVELMGGRMWVESREGVGSTFHFSIRLPVADSDAAHQQVSLEQLAGTPVLVVDDNTTNRKILERMLASWRLRPFVTASAEEALKAYEFLTDCGQRVPLVITDVCMPEVDGLEFVRRLRARGHDCAVLVLTSAGDAGEAHRHPELRLAGVLSKPIKPSTLLEAIVQALGTLSQELEPSASRSSEAETRAAEGTGSGASQQPARTLRVLAAEDNLVNQRLVRLLVQKRGHEITLAGDGREAVRLYADGAFDLVLMDVQMPEMNGFEATAAIREIEQRTGRHVPIIAMTAHAMKGDRERCLEAGMDDYISKPIDRNVLFEYLDQLAQEPRGDSRGADATAHEEPAGQPEDTEADGEERAHPLSGWDEAVERLGGDEELLHEIARAYLEGSAELVAELEQAVDSGQPERIERAAHTLKGCVANVGADGAADLALRIEQAGRAGETDPVGELFERLRAELAALEVALGHVLEGKAA